MAKKQLRFIINQGRLIEDQSEVFQKVTEEIQRCVQSL